MRGRKISADEFKQNYENVDPREINRPEAIQQRRKKRFKQKSKVDQLGIKISQLIHKKQDLQVLGDRVGARNIQTEINALMKERHKAIMTEKFVNWREDRKPEGRVSTWDGERYRTYKRSI